jgi:DNA invertase Pin-like site-specific DNA recombinase
MVGTKYKAVVSAKSSPEGTSGELRPPERSLISERTRAGVKAAQHRGVKFGRKVKLTAEQIDHARKLIDKGEARQYVADLLNVGRSTLYRALADYRLHRVAAA